MSEKIHFVPPTLESWDKVLSMPDIEYVGTRLHAGIRSLQHQKRSIIIAVDNRAIEKKKSFNLTVIERKDMDCLSSIINSEFHTSIKIPLEEINNWKKQFVK